MTLGVIILLVIVIILLIVYNASIHKKIENFNNLNQKISSLNVLQDFMNTISDLSNVNEKIKKINEILIERYEIKYSTIVVYTGTEYVVRASNVDKKHWDIFKNLHNEEIFKDSITTASIKYVTVDKEGDRLPYQKMEFGRAKSAMFLPLYIDNVYIGYWLIEGSKPHEFDNIDTTILEVVRNNIVSVLRTVEKQQVIENIVRDDKFTKLKSAEYLFGEGKKYIDQYNTSTVCLFKIVNLEEINKEYDRETGNKIVTEVSEVVKQNLSKEYVFVRYMGPKFAIVFSGVEKTAVSSFMQDLQKMIENIEIEYNNNEDDDIEIVSPKINSVISTYYKGTALEGLTKKLENYLDDTQNNESVINYL